MEAVRTEVVNDCSPHTYGFTPGDLLKELNRRMNRPISRSALFRWRQRLGFYYPPYYDDHVEALMIYGNLLSLGVKPGVAVGVTTEKMEDLEFFRGKTNHE